MADHIAAASDGTVRSPHSALRAIRAVADAACRHLDDPATLRRSLEGIAGLARAGIGRLPDAPGDHTPVRAVRLAGVIDPDALRAAAAASVALDHDRGARTVSLDDLCACGAVYTANIPHAPGCPAGPYDPLDAGMRAQLGADPQGPPT
jgi:hypothetical protein